MSNRALIYGTIAIDTLITPNGSVSSVLGGSGTYAALAARLITPDIDLTGVVGDDFPREFSLAMEARGISLEHVARVPGRTFAWTGRYERDMNHRTTVETVEGVQEHWQIHLPDSLRKAPLIAATNVTPPLQYRLIEQCPQARFTMADFMKSWIEREPEYTQKLLSRVDLALMNDEEVRTYSRTDDSIEAGYRLLEAGPRYAIVKHGSAGATLFHRTSDGSVRLFRCPAWPLQHPQDPTGAGDSFMGALAGHLTTCLNDGEPDWEAMKSGIALATVVASFTCERFGTVSLFALRRQELAERILQFHEMMSWKL